MSSCELQNSPEEGIFQMQEMAGRKENGHISPYKRLF